MKNKNHIPAYSLNMEDTTLHLGGSLLIGNANVFMEEVLMCLKKYNHEQIVIEIDHLEHIDSIGVTTLNYVKSKLGERKIKVQIEGGRKEIKLKLQTFSLNESIQIQKNKKVPFGENVGYQMYRFLHDDLKEFIILMTNVMYWSITDLVKPKMQRQGEFYNQAVLIGVNALWIVLAMSFIIGLVLAIQSATQLRNLGANIYIVDLIVIAMMSEMGPLLPAILVAGRSGSAIAAEIATMKVTSEIDALKTMGINPVRFVVIPKIYGTIVTLPFLTILADILGIFGGMIVAYFYLDISFQVFINRMTESLYNRDILIGLVKSLVFACIIVLTGSFFGLRVKQGAEGVGKVTTQAVVVSISLVFIADSAMGLLFY
ncbi:MlaE family lipid ABC transporter permease subunit [Carboxylicivirga sp. RSCT41]|uniref:MlaE family lipid ABC transporter permease subunit n=1 Tax=Carboxylicivirga agarovorans TaxID=3417570 RepID=UPI003D33A9BD